VDYAFAELEKVGYTVGSAYTAAKESARAKFLYRDMLWNGADMLGIGVASFSHVQGIHYQNEHEFGPYCAKLNQGTLPIYRAFALTEEERMIRELILQLKRGKVGSRYFRGKFGVDIQERFAAPVSRLQDQGFLVSDPEGLRLNRNGLLQVDRLLYEFFLPEHRNVSHA
jgi:oxygen-independent coproporphyrinogen III oxidase